MAYSELIKDFSRIRDYMRDFYVYGFKSRGDYDLQSTRSYDNERRRIESWLGDYMRFDNDSNGKRVFMSVDSRAIAHNPLYEAFRAKSFTDNDIILHFCILDMLRDGCELTSSEVVNNLENNYLGKVSANYNILDESTVRKKLKEYVNEGLISSRKSGSKTVYLIAEDNFPKESWSDCVSFFSESNPLGVIGSYIQGSDADTPFRFKHHYILSALDSEVMFELLLAIKYRKRTIIETQRSNQKDVSRHDVCPARFYISTRNGRRYVLVTQKDGKSPAFYRLDLIRSVHITDAEPEFEQLRAVCDEHCRHVWGVSGPAGSALQHIEMKLHVEQCEDYIIKRMYREKRNGTVKQIDDMTWLFTTDVYDARELLPWIRSFIGRITQLECSDTAVTETFYHDMEALEALYNGGTDDAVQ